MVRRIPDGFESASRERRSILLVYENVAALDRSGVRLAEAGCTTPDFELHCCSFGALSDLHTAAAAAERAAKAAMVIFAVTPEGDLPDQVKIWTEKWIHKRGDLEGTLIGFPERRAAPMEIACLKEIYLRHVALRAGMDYLSHIPDTLLKSIPDSLDSFTDRARQMTSVLDQILHTSTPPPAAQF